MRRTGPRLAALAAWAFLVAACWTGGRAFSAAAPPEGKTDPDSLIQRMLEAVRRVDFTGVQETTIFAPSYCASRQRVTQKDGLRCVAYEAPPELKGKEVFSDGSLTFFPGGGVAAPDIGLGSDLAALRKFGEGVEKVAGRRAFVVRLCPAGPSRASRRIWVDAEHFVPLRWEDRDTSGKLVSKTTFTQIRFGSSVPAVTPPSRGIEKPPIELSPALSVEEVEQRVGFKVRQPRYLPKGYRLKAVSVTTLGEGEQAVRGATSIFTNDLGIIDLRQVPAHAIASAKPGPPRETPLGLAWVRDGFHFVLSATPPLSRAEMARVAASVR